MYLRSIPRKGHAYWIVARAYRTEDRTAEQTLLYLGRLDGLSHIQVSDKLNNVRRLGDTILLHEFETLLIRLGYPAPPPSLSEYDIRTVRSYGPEFVLVSIAQKLSVVTMIDEQGAKGGGPSLGRMTLALAIYAALRPGSVWRFVEWYARSPLPWFLEMPPDAVTYDAALNALDYLQPERTAEWERVLYERIRELFNYSCERIDIDSTVLELEGTLCRLIAHFGRSKSGGVSRRRQILITFMLDQKSVLLGHEVFSGDRNDAKTLKKVNRRLKGYDIPDAPRVVDRGYASMKNILTWKRRREHFLAALKSKPKGLKLLDTLGTHTGWNVIGDGVYASSLIRDGLKWVVTWNDDVARRNGDGRRAKTEKAMNELNTLSKSIGNGRVKSRSERDRKIGTILRKHGVKRFIQVKGGKGLAFTVTETANVEKGESSDGYQVYVTTEKQMSDADIVQAYRSRDRIEKAIRTLKSCLGLGPVYLSTKEHVLGHVYVHALAYQLRSVMELRLKEGGIGMTAEQALWELEKLQVAELIVRGDEIHAARKMSRMDGTTASLMHLFSFGEEATFPGVEGSI